MYIYIYFLDGITIKVLTKGIMGFVLKSAGYSCQNDTVPLELMD